MRPVAVEIHIALREKERADCNEANSHVCITGENTIVWLLYESYNENETRQ